jgi:2-keto-3-deoxy-L-arabinonate dehydratase
MTRNSKPRYQGIFPVVPTTFTETGELDLASQKRAIDFMIDAGSDGLCILANFSEQFSLSDDEREVLTRTALEHVAGRVPVIVTTSHYSTQVCAQRSRRAQDMGAAMLMVMPPYHGATFRVPETQIYEFFARVSDAVGIPIMIQDAPASGTVLSAAFLARVAREIEHVAYFKIETPGAAAKLRELIRLGGGAIEGPWDGEEAIAQYERWLPLINIENRQCGFLAAKALMKEGGIIACEAPRHPWPPLHPASRALLIETARRLDALALRWAVS